MDQNPYYIVSKILLYVDIEDVYQAISVSKLFYQIYQNDEFWQEKLARDYPLETNLRKDQTFHQNYQRIYLTPKRNPFTVSEAISRYYSLPKDENDIPIPMIQSVSDHYGHSFLGENGLIYQSSLTDKYLFPRQDSNMIQDIIQIYGSYALRKDGALFYLMERSYDIISLSHSITKIFGEYALDIDGNLYEYKDILKKYTVEFIDPNPGPLVECDPLGLAGLDKYGRIWLFRYQGIKIFANLVSDLVSIIQIISYSDLLIALDKNGKLYSSQIVEDDTGKNFERFRIELLPNTMGKIRKIFTQFHITNIIFLLDSYGIVYSGSISANKGLISNERDSEFRIPKADHRMIVSKLAELPNSIDLAGLGLITSPLDFLQEAITENKLESYISKMTDPGGNTLLQYRLIDSPDEVYTTWAFIHNEAIYPPSEHGKVLKHSLLVEKLPSVVTYGELIRYPDDSIMMYFIFFEDEKFVTHFSRVRKIENQIYPP